MTPVPGGRINAVVAGPGQSAWALGDAPGGSGLSQLLIEHSDGATWSPVQAPSINGSAYIAAATAAPGGIVWAVGDFCPSACGFPFKGHRTLVLHWDGTAWSRIPSPTPSGGAQLFNVAAERNGTVWAVGACSSCGASQTLVLRWNGISWSRIPSPGTLPLSAVAAGPGSIAWAVGSQITRWNGAAWTLVPGDPNLWELNNVSVGSDGTAWSVGNTCISCTTSPHDVRAVILHWDGARWSRVRSPSPGSTAILWSVTTGPGGIAWAVGYYCVKRGCEYGYGGLYGHTLILEWNGSAWTQVASPDPGLKDSLNAVAVGQDGTAWAAGQTCVSQCNTSSAQYQTLILRWNGTTWVPG